MRVKRLHRFAFAKRLPRVFVCIDLEENAYTELLFMFHSRLSGNCTRNLVIYPELALCGQLGNVLVINSLTLAAYAQHHA